jgi:nitrogen regulatory protein PII
MCPKRYSKEVYEAETAHVLKVIIWCCDSILKEILDTIGEFLDGGALLKAKCYINSLDGSVHVKPQWLEHSGWSVEARAMTRAVSIDSDGPTQ